MPTPYDERFVGRDVTVLSLDGNDVLATFRRANIRLTFENADVTAVKDSGRRYRPIHYSWTIDFEGVKAAASNWLADLVTSSAGNAAFEMTEVLGGHTYTGTVTYTDLTSPYDDGPQLDQVTFQGTGDLNVDGSPIQLLPA